MHTKRYLFISTRPNWAARSLILAMIIASLYGLVTDVHNWIIWVFLVASLISAVSAFVPCTLTIDYDRDFIESRIWRFMNYDTQSKRQLRDIKLIQLEAQTGGDGPSYFDKYLVFKDGSRILLPAINNIEKIIAEWYERYLGVKVSIEQDREIKRASKRAELILVITFGCAILVFVFGERVWNQYFAEISFDEKNVICQENDCVVTFRVINRADVNKSQEFYVGVWPKVESESDTRPKGEIGFSRIVVNLKPHETIHIPVHIRLYRSRLPGGEYAMVQKV
jgi:hypothetical protein